MAYTVPRTWAVDEPLTAPKFNTDFRDNILYLKAERDTHETKLANHSVSVTASGVALIDAQWTTIPWVTEISDPSGMHDPADSTKLTPPVAGFYYMCAQVDFEANLTNSRWLRIQRFGDSLILGSVGVPNLFAADEVQPMQVSAVFPLAAGASVIVQARQNSGTTLNLVSTSYSPSFGMFRVPGSA